MTTSRKYPREFLVAEIKRVARIVGDVPTMEQFASHSKIAAATLARGSPNRRVKAEGDVTFLDPEETTGS